jgi:hypothetical protein
MHKRFYLVFGVVVGLASCSKSDQGPASLAEFTLSRSVIEVGEQVQATNKSQHAVRYRWRNPGAVDSAQTDSNPTFTAGPIPGTYHVTLLASNSQERVTRVTHPLRIGRRTLKAIHLNSLPLTRPTGQPWHADGTGPNILCTIHAGPSIVYVNVFASATTFANVQSATPALTWSGGPDLPNGTWSIEFLDKEGSYYNQMLLLPFDLTGPPANRDAEGNGSYTFHSGAWTVVLEMATL